MQFSPLIALSLERFTLVDSIHGPVHWGRVLENGMRLAPLVGADVEVVSLFAIFHDVCREHDGADLNHGPRAAKWIGSLDLPLNAEQKVLLVRACAGHTLTLSSMSPTIACCWDADRLDIGRIGVEVDPFYLSTLAAKDPEIMAWAQERSSHGQVPDFTNQYV